MHQAQHVAAMLEHQDFVRRLARGLCADPAAADDLAQDTWLSYLQNPPRAAAAVGSWLGTVLRHRAHNQRRDGARRVRREAAVARSEAVAHEDPQERLELQQRVVAAVLALDEPYRKSLLLHYYDGLSAAAIGRRLGVPAGTVRSHISRALAQLRTRLDAEDRSGRDAWRAGLLLLLQPIATAPSTAGLLAGAGLLTVATIGAVLWAAPGEAAKGWFAAPAVSAVVADDHRDAAAATATAARAEQPGEPLVRIPVAEASAVQDPTWAAMSIAELQSDAAWVQQLLRKRLLTPDADDVGTELAALHGVADVGATRLLRREDAEFALSTPLGVRGGGAYFSFATGSHSYDDEPDLSLEGGQYGTRFYGGTIGVVLPIGDVPLASLGEAMPAELPAGERERWQRLWQPALGADGKIDAAWAAAVQAGFETRCAAMLQRTYVLRRVAEGEHDVLVAFRPVAKDEYGQTIVYRVLRRFAAGDGMKHMPAAPMGTPPAALVSASAAALLQRLADIRAHAEPRLLAVPEAMRQTWANVLANPGTGIARILPRGRFDAIVASREGGAYFDFVAQTHAYANGVHLGFEQGRLSSGFAGSDKGFVVDVGEVPLMAAEQPQAQQDERTRAAIAFVCELRPEGAAGNRKLGDRDRARAQELDLQYAAVAVAGHSYLLRAVYDDHTLLVAFTIATLDADGCTFVWRILSRDGR